MAKNKADKAAKKAARKAKRQAKKQARQAKKQDKKQVKQQKKQVKKEKKQAKKEAKQQKKQEKKDAKAAKKAAKKQTTVNLDTPVTSDFFDSAEAAAESAKDLVVAKNPNAAGDDGKKKGKLKNFINKTVSKAKDIINKVAKNTQTIEDDNINENDTDMSDTSSNTGVTSSGSGEQKEGTFWEKHGTKVLIGAGVVAVGTALYFLLRNKDGSGTTSKSKGGVGALEPIDLS